MANQVYFHEEQALKDSKGIFWLMVISAVGPLLIALYLSIEQFALNHPVGDKPMTDGGLLLFDAGMLFTAGLLLGMVWLAKLTTEVRSDGVYISYTPFLLRSRCFLWSDIRDYEVRTFSLWRELGGWGIHYTHWGRRVTYNVRGKEGLLLELVNGKQVIIGTQQGTALLHAIQNAYSFSS